MARPVHPDKEIEAVIDHAERHGWTVHKTKGRGHSWGKLYCAHADRDGCILVVWSTPANPGNHARKLERALAKCPHDDAADEMKEADGGKP